MAKLFVGGLAWATNDEGLQQAFERFGTVREAKVIMDRETGRSRGFGFVTFENAEAATEAQKNMDGADLDGRSVRVNEANEKPRGGGGDRRGGSDGGYRRDDHGGGGYSSDNGGGGYDTVKRRGGGGGGRW